TMAQSMPGLNEKSTPRFEKSTDPEELERFFTRLEELFDKCAIAPDVDKKKYAVVYTDIKTEKQWKVLDHFAKGTYEEFKQDVLSSYDSALAGDRDAMQELKQLIRRYRLSPIQEKSEYMSFKREFQVLAVVLKKEGVCSNRELVDQFLAPMADSLYNSMKLRMEQLNPPAGKTSRDPVNPYTLEDVMASGLDVLQGGVYVAKDSQVLCSVFPLVNGVEKLESLYDTGSQIVSMSERIADRLGLIYDPDIVINMQSANKQVEKSLGMAKNVPFLFGDITVYLQVHIIRDPTYDVLLERPFDVLTASTVFNNTEGGQVIKIKDPNSLRSAMVPTFPWGQRRVAQREVEQGFQ
ncbi:hypothetical protein ARMSODRAFT_900176, partial [Armillaria solidipes]